MAASSFHLPKTNTSTQQQNDLSEEREKSRRSVFGMNSGIKTLHSSLLLCSHGKVTLVSSVPSIGLGILESAMVLT